jgi:hypothetical protein
VTADELGDELPNYHWSGRAAARGLCHPTRLVIGRIGLLKHADAGVLATLVLRFALPFSLFEGAVKTSPDKLDNLGLGSP